jgi:hypothetical protein
MQLTSADRECLKDLSNSGPLPQGWVNPRWPALYTAGYIKDAGISRIGTPLIQISPRGMAALSR